MDKIIVKGDYLQKIYERNPQTGNYIIPVSLDKYTDIFNDWDNAPFRKRDMDPDLAHFLEDCSEDIPLKYKIDIVFYILKQQRDESREKMLISSFRTYYSFYHASEERVLNKTYKKVFRYMTVSFAFLSALFFARSIDRRSLFLNTFLQGMEIGAWVFLWEAISIFFFQKGKINDTIKKYKRFIDCNIYFKYDDKF